MKKLLMLSVILAACEKSGPTGGAYVDIENLPPALPEIEYAEMNPGVEYPEFDNAVMFDKNGCLDEELGGHYPCIKKIDGCVRRAEYEAFMKIWKLRAPEPDIPLCDQL